MSKIELKPCPFCGSTEVIAEINTIDKKFYIFCENTDKCLSEMQLSFADAGIGNGEFIFFYEAQKIMDKMAEMWNRRAEDGK